MCVVSMIFDHYEEKWESKVLEYKSNPVGKYFIFRDGKWTEIAPKTKELELDILEFKKLLDRAKEYDKKNNEPNCELEEKKKKLLDLAKELGVEITFL